MVLQIRRAAKLDRASTQRTFDESLRRLEDELNALPLSEVAAVVEAVARALEPSSSTVPEVVRSLAGDRTFTPAERVAAEIEILQYSFARRHELLADALTTTEVADLLKTSRQTPHDRLASGTLIAVMDRGVLRFPVWQFDPDGPDGIVDGLPSVIRTLDVSPLAKISWLTERNTMLDGETPLATIKSGEIERVVTLARGVGVD